MKTTIEIPDDLLRRARQFALDRNTTLRAVVEQGLGQLLGAVDQPAPPVRFVTYGSADEPLPAQTLERIRRELSTSAEFPDDDPAWWMKRFGFVPPGIAGK